MNELEKLYEQLGGADEAVIEFIFKQCIKDLTESKDETLARMNEELEKIEILKEIFPIEVDNINKFNRIANEIEELEESDGELETLKQQLELSFEAIKESYLVLFDGYEKYENRYNELTDN